MDALLPLRWQSIEKGGATYYIKHHFGDSQYYILATDLRRVWSTKAYKDDISELAKSYSIVLETDAQMKSLLSRLKRFFQTPAQSELCMSDTELKLQFSESRSFAALSWTFVCTANQDGPNLLYDQFILPLLTAIQTKDTKDGPQTDMSRLSDAWLDQIQQTSAQVLQNRQGNAPTVSSPLPRSVSPLSTEAEPAQESSSRVTRTNPPHDEEAEKIRRQQREQTRQSNTRKRKKL